MAIGPAENGVIEPDGAATADLSASTRRSSSRRRILDTATTAGVAGRSFFVNLFDQRSNANQRLTIGLGLFVGIACVLGIPDLLNAFGVGIDMEIMLRAASHWASGGQAYPASAMLVQKGPDLPYLYPPFLLPLLAPIAALPRDIVTAAWLILCAACAAWTCRRLRIPWLAIPFVLVWPPFAEGLIVGNVQILCFAAFVALLYEPAGDRLRQRDLRQARDALNGVLSAAVAVFKITQILPVLYMARRNLRAAVIGAAAIPALVLVMLPLTGFAVYGDWLAQLQRAADPHWTIGGVALGRLVGIPDLLLAVAGIALALSIRGRNSAAWLGVAMIIATPSVHGYTFLFLVPGLLMLRRDLSILLAVLFIGVYHAYGWWMACLLVAYFLVAGIHWPWVRSVHLAPASEPQPSHDPSPQRAGVP